MNPLGKGQDTVFEIVEKGNFIAPPGGDDADQEEASPLRRAMKLLLSGIVLAALVPNVIGQWTLVPFIGSILVLSGCLRLGSEGLWPRLAALCAGGQSLALGLRLLADSSLSALAETAVYPIAGYAALIVGAIAPTVLTIGLWLCDRKNAPLMGIAAAAAIALPLLRLLGDSAAVVALRAAAAVLAAAALVCLLVRAKSVPAAPQ